MIRGELLWGPGHLWPGDDPVLFKRTMSEGNLLPESALIRDPLIHLNEAGLLTTNSQPALVVEGIGLRPNTKAIWTQYAYVTGLLPKPRAKSAVATMRALGYHAKAGKAHKGPAIIWQGSKERGWANNLSIMESLQTDFTGPVPEVLLMTLAFTCETVLFADLGQRGNKLFADLLDVLRIVEP